MTNNRHISNANKHDETEMIRTMSFVSTLIIIILTLVEPLQVVQLLIQHQLFLNLRVLLLRFIHLPRIYLVLYFVLCFLTIVEIVLQATNPLTMNPSL